VMGVESQTGTARKSERGLCVRTNARLDVRPYGETFAGLVEEWACYREISEGARRDCGPRCLKIACVPVASSMAVHPAEARAEALGPPLGLSTTMSTARPKLPSVLPSQPALQDGMYFHV
jgi:hypothetical protein